MEFFEIEYSGHIYKCPIGTLTQSNNEEEMQVWCKMLQLAKAGTKFPNGDYVALSKTQYKDAVNWRVLADRKTKTLRYKRSLASTLEDAADFLDSHGIKYWEFNAAENLSKGKPV